MSLHLLRSAIWSTRFMHRTPQVCASAYQKQFPAREDVSLPFGYRRSSKPTPNPNFPVCDVRRFRTTSAPMTEERINTGISQQEIEDIDRRIQDTKTEEDLLQLIDTSELTSVNASLAIHMLVQHHFSGEANSRKSNQELANDTRMQKLYKVLIGDVQELSSNHMVRTLLNIYSLKVNKNRTVLETLVKHIRSRLLSMDVSQVCTLVCGADLLKNTKVKNGYIHVSGLVDEAIHILKLRQRELNRLRPHALIGLLQVYNHCPQSFETVIVDAILGAIDKFSFTDIKNLTNVMAYVPYRSPAILRAVMYQAMQLSDQWQLSSVAKFMLALGELSFHNQDLAKQVADFVVTKRSEWTPTLISQIAKAYTLLRIHVPEWGLFDQICEYTSTNLGDFNSLELYNVLYAFGELGYKPEKETEFYQSVTSNVESRFEDSQAPEKIRLASALMLSGQVTEFMLKDVLQHKTTGDDTNVFQDILLMRLNAYAHLDCPDYSGPYLDSTVIPAVEQWSSALGRSVFQIVKEVVGGSDYMKSNVATTMGYKLDALVLLDEKSRPVAVDRYQVSGVQSNESQQRLQEVFEILDLDQKSVGLPTEYQRIAVLTWSPKERLFGKSELTGRYQIQKRHLQLAGYKLMEVDYKEWNQAKTKFQQLSLIKFKLVEASKRKVDNIQK